jgi:membrane-bound lytic murein transglycosylase D
MTALNRLLVAATALVLAGCGTHTSPALPAARALPLTTATDVRAPEVVLQPDPVAVITSEAEQVFSAGQAELQVGHLVAARAEFDRAIDLLLHAPTGARGDRRLEVEFDRLLDRINALELVALREGDGFSEARSEPAVIDRLLGEATSDHPQPATTTAETVAADLATTPHDLPITVNDKVLAYVELFQGNLRSFMEDGLARGARYLPMIEQVFKSEGLPHDLVYVPLIESAFKPTALSRASAKGIWQFELDTARDYGLEQNWFLDERSDPEKATRAAAQHLKMLNELFDGDWNMTLASYNAGQGRVQHAVKVSKISDYWQLSATSRFLPRDTREYVPMILAAIIIGKNPVQYGFAVGAIDALAFERVTVPDALDLRVIAEWTGVPVEQIRDLNPELRRGITPLGKHEVKVPLGTAASVEARLATADPSVFAAASLLWHDVKRGETLATIARHYKITTSKLASANDLRTNSRLKPGQRLMVPSAPAVALASRPTSTATATPTAASGGPSTYRVKPGDTLSGIAHRFDMTVSDLKRLNQLSNDIIVVGDKLTVRR